LLCTNGIKDQLDVLLSRRVLLSIVGWQSLGTKSIASGKVGIIERQYLVAESLTKSDGFISAQALADQLEPTIGGYIQNLSKCHRMPKNIFHQGSQGGENQKVQQQSCSFLLFYYD
jgi:hypothetical protein